MANFQLYKYKFKNALMKDLFGREDASLNERRLNFMLGDALAQSYHEAAKDQSLNLYAIIKNKQGEELPEIYENSILCSEGGISLIELRNNKVKRIMPKDSHEEEEVGHYPFCWVIIDTRPESQAILVQKNEAFPNPKFVVNLIADYCRRTFSLPELGWEINTELRICKGQIWDVVRTRLSGGHNRVKSLTIKFVGKNPNPKNEVDRALQFVLDKLASPEGELKLKSDDPAKKLLDETNEDMKQIIDMLIENHYRLTVGFEKGGTLEYGKNALAIYGIDDEEITNFGKKTVFNEDGRLGYELEFWLDTIMPDDNAHEYVDTKKKRRKKHNARNERKPA